MAGTNQHSYGEDNMYANSSRNFESNHQRTSNSASSSLKSIGRDIKSALHNRTQLRHPNRMANDPTYIRRGNYYDSPQHPSEIQNGHYRSVCDDSYGGRLGRGRRRRHGHGGMGILGMDVMGTDIAGGGRGRRGMGMMNMDLVSGIGRGRGLDGRTGGRRNSYDYCVHDENCTCVVHPRVQIAGMSSSDCSHHGRGRRGRRHQQAVHIVAGAPQQSTVQCNCQSQGIYGTSSTDHVPPPYHQHPQTSPLLARSPLISRGLAEHNHETSSRLSHSDQVPRSSRRHRSRRHNRSITPSTDSDDEGQRDLQLGESESEFSDAIVTPNTVFPEEKHGSTLTV